MQKRLSLAEDNLNKALVLIEKTKDYYDHTEALNDLGYVNLQRNNLDLSENYLEQARGYFDSVNDNKVLKKRNYLISSQLYTKLNKFDQALNYFH